MGPREIPQLSVLCLRAIGNTKCKADDTFAPNQDGTPSTASRLLRSFHNRPVLRSGESVGEYAECLKSAGILPNGLPDRSRSTARDAAAPVLVPSIELIPIKRTPAIGPGSGRREQANDIDLNHPWIATYQRPYPCLSSSTSTSLGDEKEDSDYTSSTHNNSNNSNNNSNNNNNIDIPTNPQEQTLVAENGSCALDLLQSYADSLVELGRMDDKRLGLGFFAEFKINIELQHKARLAIQQREQEQQEQELVHVQQQQAHSSNTTTTTTNTNTIHAPIPKKKKRKRSSASSGASAAAAAKKKKEAKILAEANRRAAILAAVPKSKGSLSLHNCEMLRETTHNLLTSRVLEHVQALDLTGLQALKDDTLLLLLQSAGLQLRRLSVKNCRRLTDRTIHNLCEHSPNLVSVDLGGDYNISPRTVVDALSVKILRRGRGVFTTQSLVHLRELHASGIGPAGGWTDDLLPDLFALRGWRALSIGFSPYLTFAGWKAAILSVEQKFGDGGDTSGGGGGGDNGHGDNANNNNDNDNDNNNRGHDRQEGATSNANTNNNNNMCQTLLSLGIAFCEQQLVDNAWLGLMGRHLPNLRALDIRGNHHVHSITSWYDGRATIELASNNGNSNGNSNHGIRPKQSLVILARYCGISQNSVEETKRIYPMAAGGDRALTVVTESNGIGWGILRQQRQHQRQSDASTTTMAPLEHYRKRLAAARAAAATTPTPATTLTTTASSTSTSTSTPKRITVTTTKAVVIKDMD